MAYDGKIVIDTKIDTKEAENDLKKLGELVKSKMNLLTTLVSASSKQMDGVLDTLLKGIGTNFQKAAESGITFTNCLSGYSQETGVATVAHNALNAALEKSAFGTVLLGISAVTTVISALSPVIEAAIENIQAQDEVLQNTKAAEARIAAVKEETEAYNERRRARQESLDGDLAEVDHIQALKTELDGLVDANGHVDEANQAKVKFILGELNPALDTELALVDGQIENYQALQGEIDKVIEKKRAEAMLSAYEETYTEAIKNRMNAYREAGEAKLAYEQELAEIAKIEQENAEDLAALEAYNTAGVGLRGIMEDSRKQIMDQDWYKEYIKRLEAIETEKQAYEDKAAVVDRYNQDIQTYEAAQTEYMAGNAQACEDILTQQSFAYQDAAIAQGATDEERRQQLAQNYAVQLAAMEEYQANCAAGTDTFNEATYRQMQEHAAQLRTQGEEAGVCYGEGQLEGLDGQTIVLTDAMREIDATVQKEQEEQRKLAEKSNSDTIDSFNEKIQEQIANFQAQSEEKMNTATNDMVENARDSTAQAMDNADLPALGEEVPAKIGEAITENAGQMTDAAGGAVDDTAEAADKAVQKAGFEAVGGSIVQAIIDGLASSMPLLQQAVQAGVQAAIAEGRGTLNGGAGGGKNSGVSGQGTAAGASSAAANGGAGPATGGRFSALALPTGRAAAFVTQTQSGMAALQAHTVPGAPRAAGPRHQRAGAARKTRRGRRDHQADGVLHQRQGCEGVQRHCEDRKKRGHELPHGLRRSLSGRPPRAESGMGRFLIPPDHSTKEEIWDKHN